MTMHSEIAEQPEVVQRALATNADVVAGIREELRNRSYDYALIAARGTSDNAARYAKYLWGAHNRIPVALAAPSLFTNYRRPPQLDRSLVVGISQSGQSPDLVTVLAEGRRQGRPTLAITNEPDSPLAAQADLVLDIRAGAERAVAATKTYTAQLLAVAMISTAFDRGTDTADLAPVAEYMEEVLAGEALVEAAAAEFADLQACAVLGRGYNHSTAFEWALKVQEVTYALAHPYSTADFRHGPIAVVERDFPILAVAPDGPLFRDMLDLLAEVGARRARTLVISNVPAALEAGTFGLPLPEMMPEWISPMVAIVAAQLFAYHLGTVKGLNPDQPRGLSKVTKTV
jgi:glucosamine--fructose-6-phosphate aminotransferase (isomerizing)